jgi:LPS O-antigen subunit length determinant protein (WzzB/FepE family)
MSLRQFIGLLLSMTLLGQTQAQGLQVLDGLFAQYQANVLLKGLSEQESAELFIQQIMAQNINIAQLRQWNKNQKQQFHENSIDHLLSQLQDIPVNELKNTGKLQTVLLQHLSTQKTGAYFLGCQSGIGLGAALLVTGAITAVFAIRNYRKNTQLQKKINHHQGQFESTSGYLQAQNHFDIQVEDIDQRLANGLIDQELYDQKYEHYLAVRDGAIADLYENSNEKKYIDQLQGDFEKKEYRLNLALSITSSIAGSASLYTSIKKCNQDS